MTSLMFMLMLQYVISMKAGLVNHVEGDGNIKATQSLEPGAPIKTGPGGFAEILLNPGSYLRLGESSEAVLDSIELRKIAVRIVSGTAVIEAVDVDKRFPLKVTSGDFTAEIIKNGIYTFTDGRATIVQGALRAAGDKKSVFKKGWQISKDGGYRAARAKKGDATAIEVWSRKRSKLIALANDNIARSLSHTSSSFPVPWDGWLWVPGLGGYTFIPSGYGFRSPYGDEYQTLNRTNHGISPVGGDEAGNASFSGNNNSREDINSSPAFDLGPTAGEIGGAGEPATSGDGIPVQ